MRVPTLKWLRKDVWSQLWVKSWVHLRLGRLLRTSRLFYLGNGGNYVFGPLDIDSFEYDMLYRLNRTFMKSDDFIVAWPRAAWTLLPFLRSFRVFFSFDSQPLRNRSRCRAARLPGYRVLPSFTEFPSLIRVHLEFDSIERESSIVLGVSSSSRSSAIIDSSISLRHSLDIFVLLMIDRVNRFPSHLFAPNKCDVSTLLSFDIHSITPYLLDFLSHFFADITRVDERKKNLKRVAEHHPRKLGGHP